MSDDLKTAIQEFLARRDHMVLSTCGSDGQPHAAMVAYVNDGAEVVFSTLEGTIKAAQIEMNHKVAYTVADDTREWASIQAVQVHGLADAITDPDEIDAAKKQLAAKFPEMSDIPPTDDVLLYRVRPTKAFFLDHMKSWGHRDEVEYDLNPR